MAYIKGWAFTETEKEERDRRSQRYEEIKHLRESMNLQVNTCYGHTKYRGEIPEGSDLSDLDILIICDEGNTCFGGTVDRCGKEFRASVNID